MSFPISMLYQPTSTGGLTNTQYIAEFGNIINNMIPESMDDYSANAAEMRIQTDPGEVGTESLATTTAEEIERLRFAIKDMKAQVDSNVSYWYETPSFGTISKSANADAFTIFATNASFSNTILTLKTNEENTGSFYYLKLISDVDGTPTTDFSIDQDGNLVCGTVTCGVITSTGASTFGAITTAQISTGTAIVRTTDITLYETTAGTGNGITIACPSTPSAWTLTLPASAPASTLYAAVSSLGAMSFVSADSIGSAMTSTGANAISATRTRATGASVAAGGVAISSSSGSFSYNTDASYVDVTNLSVTIVSSGRPIQIMVISAGTTASSSCGLFAESVVSAGHISMFLRLKRDATTVVDTCLQQYIPAASGVGIIVPGSAMQFIDTPAAGTYTYKMQVARGNSNSTARVNDCKLLAFEL